MNDKLFELYKNIDHSQSYANSSDNFLQNCEKYTAIFTKNPKTLKFPKKSRFSCVFFNQTI